MRQVLKKLEEKDLLTISSGPAGCSISEKGLELLRKLNYEIS